jgi:hypothetical protein
MTSHWKRWTAGAATLWTFSLVPAALGAQMQVATLVGLVRDSAGHPISHVEIWVRGSDLYTYTDDAGGFLLPAVPAGNLKMTTRRLGFAPASVDLTLRTGQKDSLVLVLSALAANLPGVLVEDEYLARSHRILAGFWDRRSRGFGHYFTRDEIERRDPHDFTDIVRMTAGVSIVSSNGRKVIRFSRNGGIRGDCPPQYWVDGMRLENATPDEFPPQDVEAIELYSGIATIPPQFAPKLQAMRDRTCGAIVIWTRLPGS